MADLCRARALGVCIAPGNRGVFVLQAPCTVDCDGGFVFTVDGQGDLTHAFQQRGHRIAAVCRGTAHALSEGSCEREL